MAALVSGWRDAERATARALALARLGWFDEFTGLSCIRSPFARRVFQDSIFGKIASSKGFALP
jgi:hypothetical protein